MRDRHQATNAYYRRHPDAWAARVTVVTPLGTVDSTPCTYCGEPYEETDHVLPRSVAIGLEMDDLPKFRRVLVIVPTCRECNHIAGSKRFASLSAKRQFIRRVLAARYESLLRTPMWTDDDYLELEDGPLRDRVIANQHRKEIIRRRLAWMPGYGRP